MKKKQKKNIRDWVLVLVSLDFTCSYLARQSLSLFCHVCCLTYNTLALILLNQYLHKHLYIWKSNRNFKVGHPVIFPALFKNLIKFSRTFFNFIFPYFFENVFKRQKAFNITLSIKMVQLLMTIIMVRKVWIYPQINHCSWKVNVL